MLRKISVVKIEEMLALATVATDDVNSIYFDRKDSFIVDSRKVFDTLLVNVRQILKFGDTFMSETKCRGI